MKTEPTEFKGKAIYKPKGKAGEYAEWACNFYVGCSNGCDYCYLKKGRGAKVLGGDKPMLKKCFKNETHALEVFEKELKANLSELQKSGLFFSFTTDPLLEKTINLTYQSVRICMDFKIPVKVLTKRADWIDGYVIRNGNKYYDFPNNIPYMNRQGIAFGFTLTGHDELEPNASTNAERIEAMRKIHEAGFKTFASIEPIIDIDSSAKMILQTKDFCDLYKVGLMAGVKYDWRDLRSLILMCAGINKRFYFKDSFIKQTKMNREDLPENCVNRDYNIFKI